jgi:hypothetical protein
MTRAWLALPVALLLAACGTPQALHGDARALRMDAVATLSTNPCEASIAGDYTGVIVTARAAERRLDHGMLSVERARQVLDLGRAAKVDLDRACIGGRTDAAAIGRARVNLAAMRAVLKGGQ